MSRPKEESSEISVFSRPHTASQGLLRTTSMLRRPCCSVNEQAIQKRASELKLITKLGRKRSAFSLIPSCSEW